MESVRPINALQITALSVGLRLWGDLTARPAWQIIFICYIIDYNCYDELIIMVGPCYNKTGPISVDLCLLNILIIKAVRVIRRVRPGPVVIRWSQLNSQCDTRRRLIYRFIRSFRYKQIYTHTMLLYILWKFLPEVFLFVFRANARLKVVDAFPKGFPWLQSCRA